MNRKKILKALSLLVFLLLIPMEARGASPVSHTLQPIFKASFHPQGIEYTYELPCGAEKVGEVLRLTSDDELKIGILVRTDVHPCTGLGQWQTDVFPYYAYTDFTSITTYEPQQLPPKLVFPEVEEVRGLKSKRDDLLSLQILYRTSCSSPVGILFQKQTEGAAIGIVETHSSKRNKNEIKNGEEGLCHPHPTLVEISGLTNLSDSQVRPYQSKPQDLNTAYFLAVAKIKPNSVRFHKDKLSFRFERQCNEAPIGLVQEKSDDGQKLRIGMLVARYMNHDCAKDMEGKIISSPYSTSFFAVSEDTEVQILEASSEPYELKVKQPLSYSYTRTKNGIQLAMDFYDDCRTGFATVIQEPKEGVFNVGILEKETNRPCKKRIKEVSFKQNIFAEKSPQQIFPMYVKGESH